MATEDTPTERFHLVDVATRKYARNKNGQPRVISHATWLRDQEKFAAEGLRLGKAVSGGEVAPEDGQEATGDDATGGDDTNVRRSGGGRSRTQ